MLDGAEVLQRGRWERSRTVEQDLVADLRSGWAEGCYQPLLAFRFGLGAPVLGGGFDGGEAGEFCGVVVGWGDLLVGQAFGVCFGGVAGGGEELCVVGAVDGDVAPEPRSIVKPCCGAGGWVLRPVSPGGTVTR